MYCYKIPALSENFLVKTLRKGGRAHVIDEKFIPASKIEVSWAMGDSIPHSVPTWFLLKVPGPGATKIGPLRAE
jgi:hypothetical protein